MTPPPRETVRQSLPPTPPSTYPSLQPAPSNYFSPSAYSLSQPLPPLNTSIFGFAPSAFAPSRSSQYSPYIDQHEGKHAEYQPYRSSFPGAMQLPKIQPAPAHATEMRPLETRYPEYEQIASPKHVVGSQGRRGILPSAAGNPPALLQSDNSKSASALAVAKTEDGKFLCPHCDKPYLHVKHLKRHMLRLRPYECALCHDTFSRSDILKRHFQKCSMRRGNPTGENHLAYSRANKKAKQLLEEKMASAASYSASSGSATPLETASYPHTLESPAGLLSDQSYSDRQEQCLASQIARTHSMRKVSGFGGSSTSNRGSTSSLNTSVFDTPSVFSAGPLTPDSVTTSGAATPFSYGHDRSGLNSPVDPGYNSGLSMSVPNCRLPSQPFVSHTTAPSSAAILPHSNSGRRSQELDWSSLQSSYMAPHDAYGSLPYSPHQSSSYVKQEGYPFAKQEPYTDSQPYAKPENYTGSQPYAKQEISYGWSKPQ